MTGHTPDTPPEVLLLECLQEALAHLHDPCYQTPAKLANLLGTKD